MLTKNDVLHLLATSSCWNRLEDGTFVACEYANFENKPIGYVSKEEMASVHPLLPDTLQGYMEWQNYTYGYTFTMAENISILLDYLNGAQILCEHATGGDYTFSQVDSITNIALDKKTAWVAGKVYMFSHFTGACGELLIPTSLQNDTLLVSTEHLDKTYPGWHAKWVMGETLGIEPAILSKHAFSRELDVKEVLGLPDISYE